MIVASLLTATFISPVNIVKAQEDYGIQSPDMSIEVPVSYQMMQPENMARPSSIMWDNPYENLPDRPLTAKEKRCVIGMFGTAVESAMNPTWPNIAFRFGVAALNCYYG